MWNVKAHRVNPGIHSEGGEIRVRPTPSTSEHCDVILIPLYCKFIVINCLNDCEDMKLVVLTLAVLFH